MSHGNTVSFIARIILHLSWTKLPYISLHKYLWIYNKRCICICIHIHRYIYSHVSTSTETHTTQKPLPHSWLFPDGRDKTEFVKINHTPNPVVAHTWNAGGRRDGRSLHLPFHRDVAIGVLLQLQEKTTFCMEVDFTTGHLGLISRMDSCFEPASLLKHC